MPAAVFYRPTIAPRDCTSVLSLLIKLILGIANKYKRTALQEAINEERHDVVEYLQSVDVNSELYILNIFC